MRVAAIGPERFASLDCVTGEATQMRETVKAIKSMSDVDLICYYYRSPNILISEKGEEISWADLPKLCDVAHVFTRLPKGYDSVSEHLAKVPSLLSTVYWNHCFREFISVKNGTVKRNFLRSFEYIFRRLTKRKIRDYASWCMGILPNTWAEGNVFKNVYQLRKHAICVPVPNAIAYRPNIETLEKPHDMPDGEYAVCPGIFAPRKNQIALVRAMKGSGIPIVFLGQPYDAVPGHYEKCVEESDENMYFMGHVPSTSDRYWAILKHARIAILASDCETPGIAMLEAALSGARPVVPLYGGTQEYFGIMGEYHNPFFVSSIRDAVLTAWQRGKLLPQEALYYSCYTWDWTAELTVNAYKKAIEIFNQYYSSEQ